MLQPNLFAKYLRLCCGQAPTSGAMTFLQHSHTQKTLQLWLILIA